MKRHHTLNLVVLAVAATAFHPALAQTEGGCTIRPPEAEAPAPVPVPAQSLPWTSPELLPPVRQAGGVRYRTGGIGAESAAAMRALRQDYPVAITFALRDGGRNQFTAGVGAVIESSEGVPLLSLVTEGPYLYVDLPPGDYLLKASEPRLGPTQQRPFKVVAGRHMDFLVLWQLQP